MIPGIVLALLVALANALTARLLIHAAHQLQHDSYDALAAAIAGPTGRVVAQCSLVLLLFGSFTGACTLLADVGSMALERLLVDDPWARALTAHGGRGIMMVLVVGICLPLSLLQHMRMVWGGGFMGVGWIVWGGMILLVCGQGCFCGVVLFVYTHVLLCVRMVACVHGFGMHTRVIMCAHGCLCDWFWDAHMCYYVCAWLLV